MEGNQRKTPIKNFRGGPEIYTEGPWMRQEGEIQVTISYRYHVISISENK